MIGDQDIGFSFSDAVAVCYFNTPHRISPDKHGTPEATEIVQCQVFLVEKKGQQPNKQGKRKETNRQAESDDIGYERPDSSDHQFHLCYPNL